MTKSQIPTRLRSSVKRCFGFWALGCGISLAVSAGACAKARPASVPDGPPLQVPEPPQRVLAPLEEPPAAAATPEAETPPPAAAAPRPARPASEPKPQPAPPVAAQPSPPPARGATETRELRPAAPANPATERSIRDLLARASRDLGQVNYGRLSADGRVQYEQAKRFGAQAEEALKQRNLIFASTLADKAATLASELLGR